MTDSAPITDWFASWSIESRKAAQLRKELDQATADLAVARHQIAQLRDEVDRLNADNRRYEMVIHDNPDAAHERNQAGNRQVPQVLRQGGWVDA